MVQNTSGDLFDEQKGEDLLTLRHLRLLLNNKIDNFWPISMILFSDQKTFWCLWNRGILSLGPIAKSVYAIYLCSRPSTFQQCVALYCAVQQSFALSAIRIMCCSGVLLLIYVCSTYIPMQQLWYQMNPLQHVTWLAGHARLDWSCE